MEVQVFNVDDLVEVIGPNHVFTKAGISWVPLKNEAVGHTYRVAAIDNIRGERLYILKEASDGDLAPPAAPSGRPYRWAPEWLKHVEESPTVSQEDFDFILEM